MKYTIIELLLLEILQELIKHCLHPKNLHSWQINHHYKLVSWEQIHDYYSLPEYWSEGIAFRSKGAAHHDCVICVHPHNHRLLIGSNGHGHCTDYGQHPNHDCRKHGQGFGLEVTGRKDTHNYRHRGHLTGHRTQTLTWSFRKGLTMAKYRSPERAVSVKTETPTEMSLANSVRRQRVLPIGEDSVVYTISANGTQIIITSRSAKAKEKM